jgi:1-acyl-sn-glycerol-3-phosphate acyltransferase
MRYENWDVLLFPEGSRVPIQEFKTQCFVTKDTESPYLQTQNVLGPNAYYRVQGSYGQIPILTSFIPSLDRDTPYRISIHNWDKPRPSRVIESLMLPDDVLLYEARVFVDGSCVA